MVVGLCGCVVVWLYGCIVVWLLGCWVVGLLGCWVVGLRLCWVVGLLGCVVIKIRSQIGPKSVPKASQRGPKWFPKRVPRGSYDLGRTWVAFGNFCARTFGALGPFWVPFWGPEGTHFCPRINFERFFGVFFVDRKTVRKTVLSRTFQNRGSRAQCGFYTRIYIIFCTHSCGLGGQNDAFRGPFKNQIFPKMDPWRGGARFGKQCIKRGCQQLRSLFLFDVLPFCEKLQMCDFWLFHCNEMTAAKIKKSSFFVRFF